MENNLDRRLQRERLNQPRRKKRDDPPNGNDALPLSSLLDLANVFITARNTRDQSGKAMNVQEPTKNVRDF